MYLFRTLELLCRGIIKMGPQKERLWLATYTVHDHVMTLKAKLKDIYFEPYQDGMFEIFTDIHQKALIEMLNDIKVFKLKISTETDPNVKNLHEAMDMVSQIYGEIEDLLAYLHQYFERFIDKRQVIPDLLQASSFQEVKTFYDESKTLLQDLQSAKLKELILKPFFDFLHSAHKTTFHNLFYCRKLHREILRYEGKPGLSDPDQMINLLIYMNCNSNPVHHFIINYISEDPNSPQELDNLYFWLKRIRQANVKAGLAYKLDNPNLSAMLEKWIEEEIRYLKKSARLRANSTGQPEECINTKIVSKLSVAELAFYYRTMIDLGFIKVENQIDLFRMVSRLYRTKNSENISVNSLRSKFYNIESGTKRAFRSKVIQLLNHINSLS